MKKLLFLLWIFCISILCDTSTASQNTFNIAPMYNVYNNYVTSITQINVVYTHDVNKKICKNDDRFLESYKNYNKYVYNKDKRQQQLLLNRVEKELEGLEEKWLLWNLDSFKGLCDAQEAFITFMVQQYVHNHELIDYKLDEVSKYLKKADAELNSWDSMAAIDSYKVVLYSLESLEGYDELANKIQNQIDLLWDAISKEHSNATVIKSKKNITESSVDVEKTEYNLPEDVERAREELWSKAAIFESLVPLFKSKDEKIQTNVKNLLKSFESSKDAYTRNIGIYFWYLVQ